ncbi:hypothetical protein [Williamsia muralis]|uniref:hypothetical protein n=1 Tax=Williamsia marianensis TaxID=85044 RepID=UPI000DE7AA18|nr:hypothetical protein [Williamsia marianensis]PVY26306.1 hypothetical protein C7458_11721 [Williamsia marianensis]
MSTTLPLEVRISRLRELANYVGEQPKTSAELSRTLSDRLHRHIDSDTVDRWFAGEAVPSLEERTALAVSFGFDGEAAAYLVSDNPDVYTPYALQLENFLVIANNTTGLIALRASEKPMSDKARSALARLGNPDNSLDDGV